nr:hypothetical protein B0A51_04307 [Rachicladosporium sp. CCFEE 5018]
MESMTAAAPVHLPRVAITFCTQCRWMLRATYFGQELLSTFGTSIGEIALIPATGGLFTVHLTHKPPGATEVQETLIWDRKAEGGFPETKVLKQLIRNHIEPGKDLGHSDKPAKGRVEAAKSDAEQQASAANGADVTPAAIPSLAAGPTTAKDYGQLPVAAAKMLRLELDTERVSTQPASDSRPLATMPRISIPILQHRAYDPAPRNFDTKRLRFLRGHAIAVIQDTGLGMRERYVG